MPNFVILQVAAYLDDFKPIHIPYCFASPANCVIHCVLDAAWRGTDEFDLFVNVVTHEGYQYFRMPRRRQMLLRQNLFLCVLLADVVRGPGDEVCL
jgi:hypothetical protein